MNFFSTTMINYIPIDLLYVSCVFIISNDILIVFHPFSNCKEKENFPSDLSLEWLNNQRRQVIKRLSFFYFCAIGMKTSMAPYDIP